MTSDANAKLPIPTYAPHVIGDAYLEMDEEHPDFPGDWCKADDVRGLVERAESAERLLQVMCKQCNSAQSLLGKAEAQRDRLAEVLRTAVELSHSYDSDNVACWDMVWASADDALADIEKENA